MLWTKSQAASKNEVGPAQGSMDYLQSLSRQKVKISYKVRQNLAALGLDRKQSGFKLLRLA